MAENPLLPHARLKELYALMGRVHSMLRNAPRSISGLEAVIAATLIQLEPGDVFCAMDSTSAASSIPAKLKNELASSAGERYADAVQNADLPDLSSLIALGIKSAQRKNVAISLSSSDASVDWPTVLEMANEQRVPFVPIIVDSALGGTAPHFSWLSLTRIAKKTGIPTISVDGQDAVAMYRVVQESLHRAKQGDGPAVIWCSFISGRRSAARSLPIASMERYLAVRGLLRPARKARPSA